jgi:hypothetical protein
MAEVPPVVVPLAVCASAAPHPSQIDNNDATTSRLGVSVDSDVQDTSGAARAIRARYMLCEARDRMTQIAVRARDWKAYQDVASSAEGIPGCESQIAKATSIF